MNTERPYKDLILVRPDPMEQKTASGIIIPDTAKERPLSGEIVSVGTEPMELEVGDRVTYPKFAGSEVVVDGETLLAMRDKDIITFKPKE